MRRTVVLWVNVGFNGDPRYPLIKKWQKPVDERIAMHPIIDEPITCEFTKGSFVMLNERYPSIERLADQYFPGFFARTAEEFQAKADEEPGMTVEELMLESIGCWNAQMLVREYSVVNYTGAKLSTPMEWEVAGIEEYLPKYYAAWRSIINYFMKRLFSFYDAELVMASPKYKVGGIVPQLMHVTELGYRKYVIVYPVCHNDFNIYPKIGEDRYAQQPLDYLLYSHMNYYHVVLNMYKWMLTQEGYVEPTDIVSMALVNLSLNSCGDVEPRLYMVETDDRVREALEKRFAGVGPAVDQLSKEWFERKELWQEEEFDLAANQRDRDDKKGVLDRKAAFSEWKTDIHMKEDIFSQYLEQQQRELNEDKGSKWWQFKNFMFHRWGGTGPLTRDAFNK